jgi:phage terminase large subunit-like protein
MSYIILRARWYHIIVLEIHAAAEDMTDDVKDSFCEELERMYSEFP